MPSPIRKAPRSIWRAAGSFLDVVAETRPVDSRVPFIYSDQSNRRRYATTLKIQVDNVSGLDRMQKSLTALPFGTAIFSQM